MTEIEQMYKLTNVKTINIAEYGSTYIPNSVKIDGELYPPFTAEKQIELIKWLAKKYGEIHILNNIARGFAIGIMGVSFNLKHFEEIIPMVLNTYWQDLTDQEKEEIRNILNA